MPHKQNPVLSALIRRAALSAPLLGAQLHLAAAEAVDERAAGAWHAEWLPLQALCQRAVIAGSQATDLLAGLQARPEAMQARVDAARSDLLAERDGLRAALDAPAAPAVAGPEQYLGASALFVEATLDRAGRAPYLQEQR
jgi:3-carboxy-cis,cis-muconate cycloisomerase